MSQSQIITADEVKRHNTRKSAWIVIRNEVYDVTPFIDEHPGGEDPLLDAAGQDATIAFDDVGHSEDAKLMLARFKVGTLAPGEGCSPYHHLCTECDASRKKSSIRSHYKPPLTPRTERRVQRIVVPRERRPRGPPCGRRGKPCRPPPPPPPPESSRLKYIVAALGIALLMALLYKKYGGGSSA